MRTRYSMLLAAAAMALGLSPGLPTISAQAETVVRYGISMADIPLTTGQPDRGAGAYQFSAYTIYDPLVAWEMDVSDRPGKLVPGLATEWKVDDNDKKKWRFVLRKGVKFHDFRSPRAWPAAATRAPARRRPSEWRLFTLHSPALSIRRCVLESRRRQSSASGRQTAC